MNGRVQANGRGTGPRDTDIDLVETRAAIQGDLQTNVTGVTTVGCCSMGTTKLLAVTGSRPADKQTQS